MKPRPPIGFDYEHSLLKTYIYYVCVLLLTIIIATSSENKILQWVWVYGAVRLGYLVYLNISYLMSIGILSMRVNILSGPPGCGKTFIMTVLAVIHTKVFWSKYHMAQFLYERHGDIVKYRSKLKKGAQVSKDKAMQVISLFDNALKLTKEKKLPIISNIKITFKGHTSYTYDNAGIMKYLLQKELVPEGWILCVDEIGELLEAMGYKTTPEKVKETFRLNRHFWDGYILATEQDHNNIDISVRRVVGQNFRLEKARHVGRAYGLEILNRLNQVFHLVKLFIAERLYGFRKIEYHIEANTEATQNVRIINTTDKEEKTYFFIPACYSYYNDREMYQKQFEKSSKKLVKN